MKKKYVAVMAGVAAAMAIGAPMAMAAELPGLPELPGFPSTSELPAFPGSPAGEPNGADCSFTPGEAQSSSNVPAFTPTAIPAEVIPNSGNCESFSNGQYNNQYSGQDRVSDPGDETDPQVPVQDGDAPSTADPLPQ